MSTKVFQTLNQSFELQIVNSFYLPGETAFIAFNVEGNPAPQVTWNKGFKDLKVEPRYKMWTKGGLDGENLVILGINQCRPEEEGVRTEIDSLETILFSK